MKPRNGAPEVPTRLSPGNYFGSYRIEVRVWRKNLGRLVNAMVPWSRLCPFLIRWTSRNTKTGETPPHCLLYSNSPPIPAVVNIPTGIGRSKQRCICTGSDWNSEYYERRFCLFDTQIRILTCIHTKNDPGHHVWVT